MVIISDGGGLQYPWLYRMVGWYVCLYIHFAVGVNNFVVGVDKALLACCSTCRSCFSLIFMASTFLPWLLCVYLSQWMMLVLHIGTFYVVSVSLSLLWPITLSSNSLFDLLGPMIILASFLKWVLKNLSTDRRVTLYSFPGYNLHQH